MASSRMSTIEEESDDLSHCCVCFEEFDNGERKPKFLSCHHSLCLTCAKAIAIRVNISCPVCKTVSFVLGGAERLATNMYALNIIQLKKNKAIKSGKLCWCLMCDAVPKSICQGRHIVVDVMKDVAELKSGLAQTKTQVTNHLNEAVAKREQTQEHLRVLMAQNSSCIQKLRSKMQNADGPDGALQYLVPSSKAVGSNSIKKGLKKAVDEAKEKSQEAGRFLNQVIVISEAISVGNVNGDISDANTNLPIPIQVADGAVGTRNSSPLSSQRGFSAERLVNDRPFHCKDLRGHSSGIKALEFSDDGSLLVSGGDGDQPVLIWRMDQVLDRSRQPVPSVLKVKPKDFKLFSVAISPDNSRIFVGGRDKEVFIHDTQTTAVLNAVTHRTDCVCYIALQADGNSTGAVFAASCRSLRSNEWVGNMKIFDIRRSVSDPVLQGKTRSDMLSSVMFSPADPMVIASSWWKSGTELHDIRFFDQSFLYGRKGAKSARFDTKGTRLLCSEIEQPLVCYNIPTMLDDNPGGKMLLSAQGYSIKRGSQRQPNSSLMKSPCCFAGANDELAVSASNDNGIYIWSAPVMDGPLWQKRIIDRPLRVLRGHCDAVRVVRYSTQSGILASCGDEGIVKLWSTEVKKET